MEKLEHSEEYEKLRPQEAYSMYLLLIEKCGVEFILKYKESFVNVGCPACQSNEFIHFFNKYGYVHLKCKICGTIYVSPRPTENLLFKYYNEEEAPNFWTKILINYEEDRKRIQQMPRANKLGEIIKQTKNERKILVDVGSGSGTFPKIIKEKQLFKKVIALDITREAIDACNQKGLKTHQGKIRDFEDNSLDCITVNDCIEHLFNPYNFLKDCYNKLKNEGILMFVTPNCDGFDFELLKKENTTIMPPSHLQYFSLNSVKLLLKNIGFEIIDLSTPGLLDIEIVKKAWKENKIDLASSNKFLYVIYSMSDKFLEKKLQDFLVENNLSSHMMVFAIKRH